MDGAAEKAQSRKSAHVRRVEIVVWQGVDESRGYCWPSLVCAWGLAGVAGHGHRRFDGASAGCVLCATLSRPFGRPAAAGDRAEANEPESATARTIPSLASPS